MDHDGKAVSERGPAADVTPRVSVVLPVYNGAMSLAATVDSILTQTERDLELIVVDDGSTDATAAILRGYTDPRMRVIRQENGGITRALIRGCQAARASLIARQDCGDVSRPERLERLLPLLATCVLAASEVAYFAPGGEAMYTTAHASKDIRDGLLHGGIDTIQSLPHHGSAVFRADAYERAGGYRAQFYFAQDLDLWIRMAALGDVCISQDVLYEARIDIRTISSLHRPEQVASTALTIALRDGGDPSLVEEAAAIQPQKRAQSRLTDVRALYFIAACLRQKNDLRWLRYAWRAVRVLLLGQGGA
jgi:glycosyltransferase involved in cell wall biosynthesis